MATSAKWQKSPRIEAGNSCCSIKKSCIRRACQDLENALAIRRGVIGWRKSTCRQVTFPKSAGASACRAEIEGPSFNGNLSEKKCSIYLMSTFHFFNTAGSCHSLFHLNQGPKASWLELSASHETLFGFRLIQPSGVAAKGSSGHFKE